MYSTRYSCQILIKPEFSQPQAARKEAFISLGRAAGEMGLKINEGKNQVLDHESE
jgi:hypothetical protein